MTSQSCPKCGSLRTEQRPLFTGMYTHCLACDEPRAKTVFVSTTQWISVPTQPNARIAWGWGSTDDPDLVVGKLRPGAIFLKDRAEARAKAASYASGRVVKYEITTSPTGRNIITIAEVEKP